MLHPYTLTLSSRSFYYVQTYDITSCDMSCDFSVICLFIVQKKIKKKNKINIKSEKLNKRKEKLSVSKAFHNRLEYTLVIFRIVVLDVVYYPRLNSEFLKVQLANMCYLDIIRVVNNRLGFNFIFFQFYFYFPFFHLLYSYFSLFPI